MQNKFVEFLHHLGSVMNKWRLFPRAFTAFFVYWTHEIVLWYMALNVPTVEQTAFASAFVAGAAAFFKFYLGSGPNSNAQTHEDE